MKKNPSRVLRWLFPILAVLWTAVIWRLSFQSGEHSGELSHALRDFLESLIGRCFPSFHISELFLRKLAHFTEYAILGVLCSLTWKEWGAGEWSIVTPFLSYLTVAALLDEMLIQRLSVGRGPSLRDVLIDCAGAAVGFFLTFLCFRKKKRKKCQKALDKHQGA